MTLTDKILAAVATLTSLAVTLNVFDVDVSNGIQAVVAAALTLGAALGIRSLRSRAAS
jgi:hypothetical protein